MIARLGPASGTPTQGGSSTEEGDCETVRLGRPFGDPLSMSDIRIPHRREGAWRTLELSGARLDTHSSDEDPFEGKAVTTARASHSRSPHPAYGPLRGEGGYRCLGQPLAAPIGTCRTPRGEAVTTAWARHCRPPTRKEAPVAQKAIRMTSSPTGKGQMRENMHCPRCGGIRGLTSSEPEGVHIHTGSLERSP